MPHKDPADKAAYDATYRTAHRENARANAAAYRVAHPEKCRASTAAYRAAHRKDAGAYRAAHREEAHAWSAAYYAAHPEEVRARDAAWKAAHPDECRAHGAARRARKHNAPVNDFTAAQWREVQEIFDHRCAYCGRRAKGHLTQDHIEPLSKGGSHTLANIVPACRSCNSRKHTGPPLVPVQPLLLTLASGK